MENRVLAGWRCWRRQPRSNGRGRAGDEGVGEAWRMREANGEGSRTGKDQKKGREEQDVDFGRGNGTGEEEWEEWEP